MVGTAPPHQEDPEYFDMMSSCNSAMTFEGVRYAQAHGIGRLSLPKFGIDTDIN